MKDKNQKPNTGRHLVFCEGSGPWPSEVIAYSDGASRGNPGPSSFGLSVVTVSGKVLFEEAFFVGETTNNSAEYQGLYRVLELAQKNKVQKLTLKTDSELAVRQMKGEYKVKSPLIRKLHKKCLALAGSIPHFKIEHIRREYNQRADELANLALDSL